MHLHPTHPYIYIILIRIHIWNKVRGLWWRFSAETGNKLVKPVDYFRRGSPSLMFDGFLNVTLCEEVSIILVTQGNLKLPLLLDSVDSHQTQEQ